VEHQFPCPKCDFPVIPPFYFCPNCGKKLKDPPYKFNVFKVIGLLLVSVLLPPLGLWPGLKLIGNSDSRAQIVGWLAIILTAAVIIVTLWVGVNFVNAQLRAIETQFGTYEMTPSN